MVNLFKVPTLTSNELQRRLYGANEYLWYLTPLHTATIRSKQTNL